MLSSNFPFSVSGSQAAISESLLVHGPTDDSMEYSLNSQLDQTNQNASSYLQTSAIYRTHGGGENSPPGGSKVPGQPFGLDAAGFGKHEGSKLLFLL